LQCILTFAFASTLAAPSHPHLARYADGERDMIAMHHQFKVLNADGTKETITSTLIDYGALYGEAR
jgi:hypothetical protein